MGKYIKKSKATGGLMEVNHTQASLGVRTRAKVALERLQRSATPTEAAADAAEGGGSYLQLRSRRLEKISPIGVEGRRQRNVQKQGGRGSSRLKVKGAEEEEKKEAEENASLDGQVMAVEVNSAEEVNLPGNENEENKEADQTTAAADMGVEEAFCGENVLELEGRGRTTRESTPCNLIRDPDDIKTPGSSTRPNLTVETNNGEYPLRRQIPSSAEMDAFFARAEAEQQRRFIEKYNFDPVNEKPLPGRFEWEKVEP